jgi:allophanate hydrolase subunit 1
MTVEEIAVKLANHENRIKVTEHRVADLEAQQKEIQELTISVKELAISMKNMMEEQREQGERLQKLEAEPGKNWNSVKQTTLTTFTSTIAGALAVGIILLLAYYIR